MVLQGTKAWAGTQSTFSSKLRTADAWCTGSACFLGKLMSGEVCGAVGQPTPRQASSNLPSQLRTQRNCKTHARGKKGKLQLFPDHKNNDVWKQRCHQGSRKEDLSKTVDWRNCVVLVSSHWGKTKKESAVWLVLPQQYSGLIYCFKCFSIKSEVKTVKYTSCA